MIDVLAGGFFSVMGQPVSALEALAVATGLAAVWLTVRLDVRNWPIGLVSVASYALLFFQAKLYAVASLQFVFFAFGVYGWRQWLRGGDGGHARPVTHATPRELLLGLAACAVAIALSAAVLQASTDSPDPLPDAMVLGLSLLAVWWQALKRIETWPAWIAVDAIAIPLFWTRGLPLTSLLYLVFLGLCVSGLMSWRARLARPGGIA